MQLALWKLSFSRILSFNSIRNKRSVTVKSTLCTCYMPVSSHSNDHWRSLIELCILVSPTFVPNHSINFMNNIIPHTWPVSFGVDVHMCTHTRILNAGATASCGSVATLESGWLNVGENDIPRASFGVWWLWENPVRKAMMKTTEGTPRGCDYILLRSRRCLRASLAGAYRGGVTASRA